MSSFESALFPLWFVLFSTIPTTTWESNMVDYMSRPLPFPEQYEYQGVLVLGDRNDSHGDLMRHIMVEVKGVPRDNIVQSWMFTERTHPDDGAIKSRGVEWLFSSDSDTFTDLLSRTFTNTDLRSQVRVVAIPFRCGLFGNDLRQISLIDTSNILFVIPAGNISFTYDYSNERWYGGDRRDVWQPDHPVWDAIPEDFDYLMKLLRTDNVIMANSFGFEVDIVDEEKPWKNVFTAKQGLWNVRCGKTQDNCFSLHTPPSWETHQKVPLLNYDGGFTSGATAHLAAVAYYLSQFYSTPEEIVAALRKCAIDIGEEGVDEEYGVGIANIFCCEVLNQEIKVYGNSPQSSGKTSPVFPE